MNEKDKERLARAIGEIDDDLIRDAQMPTAKGRGYGRIAAIAACLIITVSAIFALPSLLNPMVGGGNTIPDLMPPSGEPNAPNDSPSEPPSAPNDTPPTSPGEDEGGENSGEPQPPDGTTDNEAEGTEDAYFADGASLRFIRYSGGRLRFVLEISRAGCDVEIILRATDGRESYVITTDKSLSAGATILGEVKLQVNGQDATDMPTEIGLYNVELVITDTVFGEKNLDWQLEITPFDSSDFSDIVN